MYIVGAWLVIEVASILFPAWGVPETALRFLVIGATLLFPVALVFAWMFDITPDGVVRTPAASSDDDVDLSLKKTDYGILVALAGIAVLVILGSLEQVGEEIEQTEAQAVAVEKPPNSIAVIPFSNESGDSDTVFFSDGVSESILHKLSSGGSLRVLARTSSFAFRDSDLPADELSDALGVRYLLVGNVEQSDQRVRLTASLVDENGFDVWSDSFEESSDAIFDMQNSIASQVASAVSGELVSITDLPGASTQNPDAYEHYLIGKEYTNERPPGWQEKAADAFRAAIVEDPGFAPAYSGLAMALYIVPSEGDALLTKELAKDRAKEAFEMQPELAETRAVMGLVLLDGDRDDLEQARVHLERAIELDPSHTGALNWLASTLQLLGLQDESNAVQKRGLQIDPLNPILVSNYADRIASLGNFDEAMSIRSRLLRLPEPSGVGIWGFYRQHYDRDNLAESLYWAKETAIAYEGTRNQLAFFALSSVYEQLGMPEESDYWMDMLDQHHPDRLATLIRRAYRAKMRGNQDELVATLAELRPMIERFKDRLPPVVLQRAGALYIAGGLVEAGIPLLERAQQVDRPLVPEMASPESVTMIYQLAYGHRLAGNLEESERMLQRGHDMVTILRSDPYNRNSPSEIELLVYQHILRDDLQSAAIALRNAIDEGWTNYYWFYNDPFLGPAARSPELAPLFAEALKRVEEQRQIVLARDRTDNFKERIAMLMQQT